MTCKEDKHYFEKAPGSNLDYQFDWSAWLGRDKLKAVTFNVDQGLTVGSQSHTDLVVTVWLSGGQLYMTYQVRCTVETEGGRRDRRTAIMAIRTLSESAASRVYHIPPDPDLYGPPPVEHYA